MTTIEVQALLDRAANRIEPGSTVMVGSVEFGQDALLAAADAGAAAWQATPARKRFGSCKDYRIAAVIQAARTRTGQQHGGSFGEVA